MSRTGPTPMPRFCAAASLALIAALAGHAVAAPIDGAIRDTALISAKQGALKNAVSLELDTPNGAVSTGTVRLENGAERRYSFTNRVIVRYANWREAQGVIKGILSQHEGSMLGQKLGTRGEFHEILTSDVASAFAVARALENNNAIVGARVDAADLTVLDRRMAILADMRERRMALSSQIGFTDAPGITIPSEPALGGLDPLDLLQWYRSPTTAGAFGLDPDHHNNIPDTIYDTDLVDGTGVTLAVAVPWQNLHPDIDHSDLVPNYSVDLSQVFDGALPDDRYITSYAGIVASPRNNGVGGHGIAPGATVAHLFRGMGGGQNEFIEDAAYKWKNNEIDIKVHQSSTLFDVESSEYNNGVSGYATDSFLNSIVNGRGGKGVINIFSTGVGFNFLPDPYNFPSIGLPDGTFSPWDAFGIVNPLDPAGRNFGNIVGVTLTNSFLAGHGPYYVGGQTGLYTMANERRAFLINTVSGDGQIDSLASVGPGVFCSVYAGSSNEFWSGDQTVSGFGVISPVSDDLITFVPDGTLLDVNFANMTGTSVAGGIFALLLDANPNLSIRDIQHILFESIQESTMPAAAKWPNFSLSRSYFSGDTDPMDIGTQVFLSFWQLNNAALYTGGPVVNQTVRHSDQYGFGVVDTDLAVQKALTWGGVPDLIKLDTGIVTDDTEGELGLARIPFDVADAEWNEVTPADGESGTPGLTTMTLNNNGNQFFQFCVRNNIMLEQIVVTLSIEGVSHNDLYIELVSPSGMRSNLLLPTTQNTVGTTDDEFAGDDDLDANAFTGTTRDGTAMALVEQPFLTYKHWGELAGGEWTVRVRDYGPDEAMPEGEEPGTGMDPDPGADMEVDLGIIGVPGGDFRDEKTVVDIRIEMYGTNVGAPIFDGCNPFETSCPGDLNADGIISTDDFFLFLTWWQSGDFRADLDDNGIIDYFDLRSFLGLFQPGFCTVNTGGGGGGGLPPFTGGRPHPNTADPSDNNPITQPI